MTEIIKKGVIALALLPLIIFFGPIIALYLLCIELYNLYLKIRVEFKWPLNRHILFSYSDSENWTEYIEREIVPKIADKAIVINRTQEQDWKKQYKLEKKALDNFAGTGINPVALIFRKGLKVKVIPFYEAFRDLKHGKKESIELKREELFKHI